MSVPPFRFRLERVRALRERAEEQAREELAATLSLRLRGQAIDSAALDLHRADAEVDARRDALARAARERSVLERLKERRRAAHAADAARAETAELDELAITRHRREEDTAA